jgi:hypothetical protein
MSTLDKLVAMGAQAVGGDLVLKHKSMGQFRNGEFYPSAEGLAMAEIDDAVIKTETTKTTRKKAADAAPAADEITIDV